MARTLIVQFPMENTQFGWFLVPIKPDSLARTLELHRPWVGPAKKRGKKPKGGY